jgi:hypothetical protein
MKKILLCIVAIFLFNNAYAFDYDGNWLLNKCSPITYYRDLVTGKLKETQPTISSEEQANLTICLAYIEAIAVSHYYTGTQEGNKTQVCAYGVGYQSSKAARSVMVTLIKATNLKDSEKFYQTPAAFLVTEVLQGNYPCKQEKNK